MSPTNCRHDSDTTFFKNVAMRHDMSNIADVCYTDDIATTSSSWKHAQEKLTRLSENGERTGLIINKEKTKCIRINPNRAEC